MCRLLGWVSGRPQTVEAAISPQGLAQFTALSRLHKDGWGMAWWPGAGAPAADQLDDGTPCAPELVRSASCAADDPAFARLTAEAKSAAGIVHLRLATPGLAVLPANTHPFGTDDLAMIHNGGIYPLERLADILPPEWEAKVEGTTDSERYFLSVVAGRQATGNAVADVVADAVVDLFANWQPSSLNAMCLTPDTLIVVSAYDPAAVIPTVPEPTDAYFTLRYREGPDGVVVASSGIDQPESEGWKRLENMTLTEIDRTTAAVAIRPLDVTLGDLSAPEGIPRPT